jgi:aspartyl-tRNA(Asn)/glutamyl-tRNA(Gln) amidotransferase subunit C
MSLTRENIESIAHLARLALDEREVPTYQRNLSNIIEFVSQLERVDTAEIRPMAHPLPGQSQRLRADGVTETDQHEKFQANAPRVEAGLYLVPKVIE